MDEMDELVSNDTELLDWFYLDNFYDLAIALERGLGVDVWFPECGDGSPDDSRDEVVLGAAFTATAAQYPVTIRELLQLVVQECVDSPRREWCLALEAQIRDVEGIVVAVRRDSDVSAFTLGDAEYPYVRACNGALTAAAWRRGRIESNFPGMKLDLLQPDGTTVSGKFLMSTLRTAWASTIDDYQPEVIDVPAMATVLAVAARQYGLLFGNPFPDVPEPERDFDAPLSSLEDVVSWFHVGGVEDVEALLSETINAVVTLDEYDAEDADADGDDMSPTGAVKICVYNCETEVVIPFTMAELMDAMVSSHQHSDPFVHWREFERRILEVERVKVQIWRRPWEVPAGSDLLAALRPAEYPYQRAASGSSTVAAWRRNRLTPHYADFTIAVLDPVGDRDEVPGQTHMATLRRGWVQLGTVTEPEGNGCEATLPSGDRLDEPQDEGGTGRPFALYLPGKDPASRRAVASDRPPATAAVLAGVNCSAELPRHSPNRSIRRGRRPRWSVPVTSPT